MCLATTGARVSRRAFVVSAACSIAALISPTALGQIRESSERTLAFRSLHTGERLSVTYWQDGRYLPDALGEINYLLRDHRNGQVHPIDRELLDTLHALQSALGFDGPYEVISGYRSPQTNEMLRRKSQGVAENSRHMKGEAIDVRVPGQDLQQMRKTAVALEAGGVGHYSSSGFLHLDVGPVRTW